MTAKTNAARILDNLGIAYELRSYATLRGANVDPEDLRAVRVAAKVGLPPGQVFKTLVARGDRHGVCLALTASASHWWQATISSTSRPSPARPATAAASWSPSRKSSR